LLSSLLVLIGCTVAEDKQAPTAVASLDENAFQCTVEPVLIRDCSYLGCHGQAGFPLRVYSVGKLRIGSPASLEDRVMPLTPDERHANYLSAVAFTFKGVAPADNWLLRKPLPPANGGYEHVGGAIFTGTDDVRALAIRHWLEGNPDPCPPVAP
jgi:hypothetical protein